MEKDKPELTPEEMEFLRKYRQLSEQEKRYVRVTFEALEQCRRDAWRICREDNPADT